MARDRRDERIGITRGLGRFVGLGLSPTSCLFSHTYQMSQPTRESGCLRSSLNIYTKTERAPQKAAVMSPVLFSLALVPDNFHCSCPKGSADLD
jgi:hypothetical protein